MSIAYSFFFFFGKQAQKAKDKEENEQLMEDLDKNFESLLQTKVLSSMTEPGKMNALKSLANKDIPDQHLKKNDQVEKSERVGFVIVLVLKTLYCSGSYIA